MKTSPTLFLACLAANLFSAMAIEVTPNIINQPIFPARKIENVREKLIQNEETELLKAIGWTDTKKDASLHLVHSERITLNGKLRIFLIFDSSSWTIGDSPRVLALLDGDYRVQFLGRFDSAFPFGYATFIQSPSDKDADLVIIDPATRFAGELLFHRYKVTSNKISSISDGYTWNRVK